MAKPRTMYTVTVKYQWKNGDTRMESLGVYRFRWFARLIAWGLDAGYIRPNLHQSAQVSTLEGWAK